MCGIAGFFLRGKPAGLSDVQRMCDAIRHRGPDDEGFYLDGGCALGMRRLSIIDLNTGHQPIANEDQSDWVVCNGEIYNYQELRRDLLARGHRLTTQTDTETIVHLYEDEGPAAIARLRGMFAVALWDAPAGGYCWPATASEKSRYTKRSFPRVFISPVSSSAFAVWIFLLRSTPKRSSFTFNLDIFQTRQALFSPFVNCRPADG